MTTENHPTLPTAGFFGSQAVPEDTPLFTADQMRAYADATEALRHPSDRAIYESIAARYSESARASRNAAGSGISDAAVQALESIAAMTFDRWSEGYRAGQIAIAALDKLRVQTTEWGPAPVGNEADEPRSLADRLDLMADAQAAGSTAQSDLYAAATVWRKHLRGQPATTQADSASPSAQGDAELARLRELAATCYAGLGAECNLPEAWLDALSAAASGQPFTTDGLLPFTASRGDEAQVLADAKDSALLDWFVDHPNAVRRSYGYRGQSDGWWYDAPNGEIEHATDLRDALRAARGAKS